MRKGAIQYTQQELAFIEYNKIMARRELTSLVNETFGTSYSVDNIKSLCTRNKWNTGRTGKFEKGNIPSPLARMKGPNKTSFKKGSVPINRRCVGSERINVEGYREIKVKTGKHNWELKHRVVWEKHHQVKLKSYDVIRFIDGNRLNCDINNLEQFNRAEHARLNQLKINDMPDEVKPAAKTMVRLIQKTADMENKKEYRSERSGE